MQSTATTLQAVIAADEDFEWYPTTAEMIAVVRDKIKLHASGGYRNSVSIMDIGAGDGRVLAELAKAVDGGDSKLYAIEKSAVLIQAQPDNVIPVGTDFFEQNLASLQVDYIFCNPPYSQFDAWACQIIESGYARRAYLVIPRRWKDSPTLAAAIKKRDVKAKVIYSGDFLNADRRARAVIDIVEISYPMAAGYSDRGPQDPFDQWFEDNVSTFDEEKIADEPDAGSDIAKKHNVDTIGGMVDAFNEEYGIMEENYRRIFQLDYALLKELGVEKEKVREGIKKRMAGLKTKYWQMLFERLDTITSRLSTATKKRFREKLTGQTSVAFTASNAYAVVLWAIKNANKYFDEQVVQLFRDLATFDGVSKYKSNQKTWQADNWRFNNERESYTHYALDYRIVVSRHQALEMDWDGKSRDRLADRARSLLADVIAVMGNLGFPTTILSADEIKEIRKKGNWPDKRCISAADRTWTSNVSEEFVTAEETVLFEVKAFKNGNLHLRFRPDAIKALNIEAGRLLGWIKDKSDVVAELGYTVEDADKYFNSSRKILPSNVKLLCARRVHDAKNQQVRNHHLSRAGHSDIGA